MLNSGEEQLVSWAGEPSETELLFSRSGEENVILLEIAFFETAQNPREKRKPNLKFIGSYDEICIPFWRALQDLQIRYFAKLLESEWRWTGYFPTRELDLLTEALGKSK
ncbi:hypothetical protein B1R32_1121 [Abditibacterium utsteinense]|uniref:Uncharacterized protein n=1 Tax=Abditibacterium utsteinense TaxID=1960156 RepID=A0A2S8SRE1_9BACT|nr:hypothetical protein [Abditibacterium utsteinense]PQV63346.1 hypothetical protein B1R32_1121 [Abditibacterium utsteinense]